MKYFGSKENYGLKILASEDDLIYSLIYVLLFCKLNETLGGCFGFI